MINRFKEQSKYLLSLKEIDLGELVSWRFQTSLVNYAPNSQLEDLGEFDNPEDIFALTYDYHYHSRYAKRLRKVVSILADNWSQHEPHIIQRNPKPLSDLLFLASYIGLTASPAMDNVMSNPRFRDIVTQPGETFGDLKAKF
jgi:hypothetical protein